MQAISHNYAKVKGDLYDPLSIEKTLTCIMLLYSLSQFLLKIKISTTTKYFHKKVHTFYIKITITNKFFYKLQMLYYDRIDVSKVICIKKTIASKECDIYHSWYFLYERFTFHLYVCNGCHDVLRISIYLSDVAFLRICSVDYCCVITGISKSETITLNQNIDLGKRKTEHYKI